ncbi:Threonylcarbamoyl-AMP synthase [archaeon HR06]|nr:Threonylcarbamoyl-AMP synthase [archaeon HR06]
MLIVKGDEEGLKKAAKIVLEGGVIVYPTDTVYGIGCDPYNEEAVKRIIEIKERELKPMPILCSSMEVAKDLIYFSPKGLKLAEIFWPGPLTIVDWLKDNKISILARAGENKLGIRIPDNPLTLKLIQLCGSKLIGTSANKSGLKSPKNSKEVLELLGKDFDLLIDGGDCKYGLPSTVIDLTLNPFRIVREGVIRKEEVMRALV